jgi:hypothetical protein
MTIWVDALTDHGLSGPLRLRVRGRSMLPTLRPGDEVVVHPATAEVLAPGDWIVVRDAQGVYLHRYLGRRNGRVLTKGDGHRALDPSWPPDAVLGRVVEAQRDGRCFYRRTPGQLQRERLLTTGHRVFGDVWGVLRRVKAVLLALYAAVFTVVLVGAAVTLTGFTAEIGTESITLKWETASETNNLGFRLFRGLSDAGNYDDISDFIASLDEGAGAVYEYEDTLVTPGITYYYKLKDVPDDGSTGEYTTPISATIPLATSPTVTPTQGATPTATVTPSPTTTPSASPTPNPNVRFWASKTDLSAGECATVYWQTNNILSVHFNNAPVPGDGERVFCPCATESHTLRVKYPSSTTEEFVVTLNVTGQCTDAPATAAPTSTPTPRAPSAAASTATPRPTFTPGATSLPENLAATASVEAFIATATASAEAARATWTPLTAPQDAPRNGAPDTPHATDPFISPLVTPESQAEAAATAVQLPVRGPVEGESTDVPVEKLLSVWLLIVGGIAGAGFVGAGILMWKRQQ